MKARRILASDEGSWRSVFFQSPRHFSGGEIVGSTTQRFGMTAKLPGTSQREVRIRRNPKG